MKHFLIKSAFFLLPIIVIAYPLDYVMSYYLSHSHDSPGEFEVWNDIYSSNANCDIAIYGSSRAWVQIDPNILGDSLNSEVYNFGMDGHNFWLQYLRHLELLKHNQKPKVIVLSVDVFTLQKRPDLYQQDQFLPNMLWNSTVQEYTSSYTGYKGVDYYIPLIRYAGRTTSFVKMAKTFFRVKTSSYRNRGFLGMERVWNNDLAEAKAGTDSYTVNLDASSIALFDKFIKQCKRDNIKLFLVYAPEFIDGQKFVSNRNLIIGLYKSFSNKYSIPFWDYSEDTICQSRKYFYNASHLNKQGAEMFSRMLASDLKNTKSNSNFAQVRSQATEKVGY
ncbi:MAG: hypothetical protein ACO1OO_04500 [Flavisolibacter sp.]